MTTDIPFPKTFQPQCKKILTRLYRVFVHVYVHHFDRIMSIGAEPHVNTCYKHFYYFVTEFDLINEKEFAPLQEMTRKICTDIIAPPTPTGDPTGSNITRLIQRFILQNLTNRYFLRTLAGPPVNGSDRNDEIFSTVLYFLYNFVIG